MSDLEARLLMAHQARDMSALVALYREAAERAAAPDARGFYLTQALVYALELGAPEAADIRNTLVEMGRETTG